MSTRREFLHGLGAFAALGVRVPAERPELVLHNGRILTMDGTLPRARAVAVGGGRFMAVGDDAAVRALASRGTRVVDLGGRTVNQLAALGHVYGRAGNHDRARALLGELMARTSELYVAPMWIALVHLGLGDLEGLFQWMNRAYEERDGSLVLISAAVEFDPVREDPRFKAILERMGLGHLAAPCL